jgi:hypothetical protein
MPSVCLQLNAPVDHLSCGYKRRIPRLRGGPTGHRRSGLLAHSQHHPPSTVFSA